MDPQREIVYRIPMLVYFRSGSFGGVALRSAGIKKGVP